MKEEFGRKIRGLRQAKGMTQEELSEILEVSKSTVSQWETGKRYPNANMLVKIVLFFKVTCNYLLGL